MDVPLADQPADICQRYGLTGLNRHRAARLTQFVSEIEAAARMAGIEKDRLPGFEDRGEAACIMPVRNRGHDQHDQVGALDRFGKVTGHVLDWDQPLVDPTYFDPCLPAQGNEPFLVAGMQSHREAPFTQISGGGAAAVAGSQDSDRLDHGYFRNSFVAIFDTSTGFGINPMPISIFCISSHRSFVE